MHAVKVDSRKIMAIVLVIAAVFAAVAITTSLFYLDKIQSLVRNTTTTSVIELTTARARYLEECVASDLESVETLAGGLAHASKEEARGQALDFIATHGAAVAWIQFADGSRWCSSTEPDLFPADLEASLFDPALNGQTGSSPMYPGHNDEKRILFYAPIAFSPTAAGTAGASGAVYVSWPADELQNSYGTTYTSAGETYVIDSSGTIVLDANRSTSEASQGSLADMLLEAGNKPAAVDDLLEDIAANREGDTVLMLNDEKQFVFFTPLASKPGWSLITLLPLSVVEHDGAQIVGLTSQMVAALAAAVLLAGGALVALSVYRNRRERERDRYVQSLYQAIGTNIDTAILIVDRESRTVEAVFENIERIMGVPARKFFVIDPLSPNEAYAKVAAVVHSAIDAGSSCWEFQCDNPALGRAQWLRISSCNVLLGGEEKIIFSIFDATGDHAIRDQLTEAAQLAEDANRAKSSFLSSMSHDIRTPMNAILGFSTLIEREASDEEKVRDYNRKIATSGQHLLGLINDVLDMSKIESGKTTLAAEAFTLSETAAAVEAMMRQQTDAKGQTFTVEVHQVAHDRLIGDEGRLRQILMNILSNAMKYTPDGGDILFRIDGSLKLHGTLQHLRIIVRDNGIGMSKEYLATIFDSFSREETAATSKIQGTGLGMAITKNLVDLMGGTISVESELGQGSTFIIDLDFAPAPEAEGESAAAGGEAAAPADTARALAGKHVLVAEDNDLNAEIIAAILGIHEATCDVAANGREAVEKFSAAAPGTYDLIFMDVQMPEMNGHEAARAIRALTREDAATVPIIAMTANAFAEDAEEALAAGMNAHVAKPIDVKNLEQVVASLS